MKPESKKTENKHRDDLETFEELPAKAKESLLLGDEAEKAAGKDRVDVDREIKRQSGMAQ